MSGKFFLFTRLTYGICYLFFCVSIGHSQSPTPSLDLKKIVPPSPNASALGQYGNMPVGLYTGTSQFTIPIYEVNEGQLKLPVSLSYNSGGIKVTEMASWVGLGFTLNAGGVITRTVYGTPDENGLYAGADSVPDNPSDQTLKDFMTLNSIDYQPDVFTFNFNGKTGKFFMNRTSFVPITPYQNLKIQVIEESGYVHEAPFNGISGLLSHWRITDEDGIVYEFADYETNRARTVDPSVEDPYDPPPPGTPLASINSWYLSKMYSPTGDTIKFVYEDYAMEYDMPSSEQKYVLVNVGSGSDKAGRIITNITHCKNTNKRLREIIFSNGSLKFIANTKRADLSGDTLLNEIQLTRPDGSFVKGYQFDYKYSVAGSTSLYDTTLTTQIYSNSYADAANNTAPRRLMLMGISELNSSRIKNGKNYSFEYELSIGLPDRFSKSRDLWGYYNGSQTDYEHVLQYQVIGDPWDPDGYLILGKDPDFDHAKQNMLKKITYPTGGTTAINYELNKAYVGKTVLPPESIPQSCTMSMVFENYNTLPYTDTLINGVKNYYKTFEVNIPTGAHLNILISGMLYQGPSHSMTFEFYDSANQLFLGWDDIADPANQTINQTYQTVQYALTWLFPKGVYKIIFKPIASYIGNTNYHDTYQANPAITVNGWSNIIIHTDSLRLVRDIGGLRIKSTVDYDPVSGKNFQKNYDYTVPGDTISSGELLNEIKYVYPYNEVAAAEGPGFSVSFALFKYMVLNNESNYPLSTTQGSYVGYSAVTVTESDPKTGLVNGKTEYYYTSPKNFPDYYAFRAGPKNPFPYPPADSRDWLRGRLLRKIDYRLVNSNSSPVKIEKNTYGLAAFVDTTAGLVPRYITRWISSPPSLYVTCPYAEQVTYERYGFTSGYSLPVSKETTEIQEGHPITTTQNFEYGSAPANMLPTKTSSVNSQGDSIITKTKYSTDFTGLTAGDAATQGILQLQQKHILSNAVEHSVYNKKSATEALTSSQFTSYKPASPLQDTIFLTESAIPIPDFVPAYVSSGSVVKDTRYKPRLSSNKYGIKGNLMEQSKFNDVKHAYLWGYQLTFPIAECLNADSASIAATSFEADGTGNWSITSAARDTGSVTGSKSYKLDSGAISKSGLASSKNYIVTYWTKNASAYSITGTVSGYPITGKKIGLWTYFEHKITGQTSVNLSGTGNIDELRLYPDSAQMTTYAYDPLVGVTSQCDLNNRITYYEYDGLQRLKLIRDQDKNIIKTIQYQYANSCGDNCTVLPMLTFNGSNTISYPVGVFNVNEKLLGNATTQAQYVTIWNADTADQHRGVLSAGLDSMHFNLAITNVNKVPNAVTGCRYYQYDFKYNDFTASSANGEYVDFGDSTGMRMAADPTGFTVAPNTAVTIGFGESWFDHTYPDTSLRTISIYHSDGTEDPTIASTTGIDPPYTWFLSNVRGNYPQNMQFLHPTSYTRTGALSVAGITNWSKINSIIAFGLHTFSNAYPCKNLSFGQDFMAANKNLQQIDSYWDITNATSPGYVDSTFKISRIKSNWNTYFTNLRYLAISDYQWNRENLSALPNLVTFILVADNQHHDNSSSPAIPIPTSVIDNVIIQIAAGSGQVNKDGVIWITTGGTDRTSASDSAYNFLTSRGWTINLFTIPL